MHNVAKAHADLKQFGDAVKVLEETLSLQKAKLPPGHPNTIQTMYSLANNYGDQNRFTEALKLHQETLELRKEKLGLNHRSTLFSMWGVVANLIKLDRGAEAVPLIDECLRRAADDVVDPRFSGLADKRLELFVKAKDPNGCRTTAELWEKLKCTDAASLYNSARYRAVTAATIRASGMSADANREADAEADRAIAWLKHSVAAGFKDVAKLAKDADLDALRPRADFQSLLAEVKSAQ